MKYGILMILGLLFTTLWMTGCDAVGDNEPNVSRETLERIQSSPQDLPPSMGYGLEALYDSTLGIDLVTTQTTDTLATGDL